MFRYILQRIAATLPVMVIVGVFVFLLLRVAPGDPAAIIAGDAATADNIQHIREHLGLNKPLFEQFVIWLGHILQGDLGHSYFFHKEVVDLIIQRLEPTLMLSLTTISLAVLVSVPLGVVAAWRRNSWIDRGLMGFSVVGFSVPVFVLGYILIYIFAVYLQWLPVQGYQRIREVGLFKCLTHLLLPSVTLSVIYIALIARVTRATVGDVLNEDYIRTARSKGLPDWRVLWGHAVQNAAPSILTVIGIGVALLIGGVVVTESVYGIPGLGRLTVDAVLARDFPTIQGVILLFSFTYVLLNLSVDLACALIDPRIRYYES